MSAWVMGQLVVGLILLVIGAEALVRGASKLAASIGISSLVIGLTVVAFGTSTPEFAVSVQSGLQGQADIAVGNVVGSSIFNVLFILGLSAMISPLLVSKQLIRFDVPIMIGASILTYLFVLDGRLILWEGLILFAGVILYTTLLIRQSRRESAAIKAEYEEEFGTEPPKTIAGILANLGLIVVGVATLIIGSRLLVDSAVVIANALGVSQLVIGLTIIAGGTSLPEVATSVVATLRGERDIAVGNVVGSNIFNLLAVLGLSTIVSSGVLSSGGINISPIALSFDIPFMLLILVACWPIFFTGSTIARWEGLLFLLYYVAYTLYLVYSSNQSPQLATLSTITIYILVPITLIALLGTTIREVQSRRQIA